MKESELLNLGGRNDGGVEDEMLYKMFILHLVALSLILLNQNSMVESLKERSKWVVQ